MAPTLAAEMLPYSVMKSRACSPAYCRSAQILEIQQQEALVAGNLEHQVEHAGLHVVEPQHASQQQRSQVGYGPVRTGWPAFP